MARKAFIMSSNGPSVFGPLKYAEKDADDIAINLKNYRFGFEIVKPEKGSKKYDILDKLEQVVFSCEPDDTFICYFAGHGHLPKGQLALLVDDNNDIDRSSLDFSMLYNTFKKCKARNKLIILDCCHAGGAEVRDVPPKVEDVIEISDSDNYLVLMASERISTIREYPDLQGSFLSQKICEGLDKSFHDLDNDNDQRISISDLYTWLKTSNKLFNANKDKEKQAPLPYLAGQIKGSEFWLTQDAYRWTPQQINCADGTELIVLPVKPKDNLVVCIGKQPVTNYKYKIFVQETGRKEPCGRYMPDGKDIKIENWEQNFKPWENEKFNDLQQPVVCVSYLDAVDFCNWLQAKMNKTYDEKIIICPLAVWNYAAYGDEASKETYGRQGFWLSKTTSVHTHTNCPAVVDENNIRSNPVGTSDLFGNVWEWCNNNIGVNISINQLYQQAPVLKGGGFLDDLSSNNFIPQLESLSFFNPYSEYKKCFNFKSFDLGFRIAAVVNANKLSQEIKLRLSLCKTLNESFWKQVHNQNSIQYQLDRYRE